MRPGGGEGEVKAWRGCRIPTFTQVPNELIEELPRYVTTTAALVAVVVSRYALDASKSATHQVSVRRIAEVLALSERTVQRALAELEAIGVIERVPAYDSLGQEPNEFRLVMRGGGETPWRWLPPVTHGTPGTVRRKWRGRRAGHPPG